MTFQLFIIYAVTVTLVGIITDLMTSYIEVLTDPSSFISMSTLPFLVSQMPKDTLHVLTGNVLGDGCLRRTGRKMDGKPTGNARFEMNKAKLSYNHHLETFNAHYKRYSGVGFRENTY